MSDTSAPKTYSTIYAFGDSLSDAGNLSISTQLAGSPTPTSPYFQESYPTPFGTAHPHVFSDGPVWVQDLSTELGLGTLEPSLLGGNDFAYGGAETGSTPQNSGETALDAISLPSQLVQFQTEDPNPSAGALYTLSIGSNDILDILADPSLSAQQQTTDVDDAVNNEISFIQSLAGDGAENLLVLDIPDLGKTPEVLDGLANGSDTPSPTLDALATSLASEYNTDLSTQLATVAGEDNLDAHLVNVFGLIDDAVAAPEEYGLTNVTTPVWSGTYSDPNSGTLAALGTAQSQYLFYDHLHPTETGEYDVSTWAESDLSGPACYAEGTRIATVRGEVMVQDLRAGDVVLLADGGTAPVVWLGHRRVDCRRHPRPADMQPVRIAAHAFGLGRPHSDLLVSPDHAVFVEGVLIPVRYLLNGATVRQEEFATVTYWHVELPAHAVLLAEGLPAESFLDTGNRAAFANGGDAVMAHADFSRRVWDAKGCAPLATGGDARDLVYKRLLAQAFLLGWGLQDAGEGASAWIAPERAAA